MFGFESTNWRNFYLLYTALCCVVPMIALAVGLFVAYRRGSSFVSELISPELEKMEADYQKLRQKNPALTDDQLVNRLIRRQSMRCGIIGGLLGFPGLPALPITLPLDMVASYRIQATMVNFIARTYEHQQLVPGEEAAITQLVMFGNASLTRTTSRAATKAITSVATDIGSRFVAKLIPFAGAIIGFAVNYFTTQATGRMAAGVFRAEAQRTRNRASQV